MNEMLLQHPDITAAERTGYPSGKEPIWPRCPECGEECETIFKAGRFILGCDCCIQPVDAWLCPDCFPEV